MADNTEEPRATVADAADKSEIQIDTSEVSRGAQKVELDLEDAPFLEEEEEEVQPAPLSLDEPSPTLESEAKPSPFANKKKLLLIVAAVLLLVGAAVAVKFLFFSGKAAHAPAPQKSHAAANATAAPPVPPELQVHLDPFWVEQKQGEEIRFLIVRILLTTTNPGAVTEYQQKLLPIRNAIFYYLKNKDVQFLSDEQNAERLKSELLLVINQYVADGKFDHLMFEEYVVK